MLRRPAPRVKGLDSGGVNSISLSLNLLGRVVVRVKDIPTRGLSAGVGSQLVRPCTWYSGLSRTTSETTVGFPGERRGDRFPASSDINNNISQRQRTHNTNQHTTRNTNYNTYYNITVLLLLFYGQRVRVKGESKDREEGMKSTLHNPLLARAY